MPMPPLESGICPALSEDDDDVPTMRPPPMVPDADIYDDDATSTLRPPPMGIDVDVDVDVDVDDPEQW
jgi:hypothetical protein